MSQNDGSVAVCAVPIGRWRKVMVNGYLGAHVGLLSALRVSVEFFGPLDSLFGHASEDRRCRSAAA
jgi:hypothetical protein